jgi:hypothetical protein
MVRSWLLLHSQWACGPQTKLKPKDMHCFFYWPNSAKFRPEKYDLDIFKRFFMRKMAKIRHIWNSSNSKSLVLR